MNPQPQEIDYTPLSMPVRLLGLGRRHFDWYRIFLSVVGLLVAVATMAYGKTGDWQQALVAVAGMVAIILVICGIMLAIARFLPEKSSSSVTKARLRLFAEANRFHYLENAPFSRGGVQFSNDGYIGLGFRTQTVEIGNYLEAEDDTAGFGYMALRLPYELPQIVFDAAINNVLGTNLAKAFDPSARVAVDADFDALYTVYAPPGYDTVARQLAVRLRPLLVAEEKGYFDVEIRGNALYVYTTMFTFETAEVGRLLAFATKLRAVCGGVALGSSSAAVEGEAATTLPVVSKINWSFIVVVLFLGVAFMPAFPGSEALDGVRAAALYALFIAIAVWAVRQIKAGRKVKRQLRNNMPKENPAARRVKRLAPAGGSFTAKRDSRDE